jgi:hypothetical protein
MAMPSGSRLQRAFACPSSAVLPQFESVGEEAWKGTVKHEFFANLQRMDRDEALALVPEEYREACEMVDVSCFPIGAEWLPEVALAYDVVTGKVRHIGNDIGRNYGPLAETEIPMTLDLVGRGGVPMVIDYKTGRGWVTKAKDNWQLRAGAVGVSKWLGVSEVRVGLFFVREGSSPGWDSALFDAFDLASFEDDLRGLRPKLMEKPPNVTTGAHCRYCPAFASCPAQAALVKRMANEPETLAAEVLAKLTPETAGEAWKRLRLMEATLREVKNAITAFAHATPIPIGEGRVLGEWTSETEEVDPLKARTALEGLYGRETAERACEFETSKAAITRAIRPVYEEKKRAGEKVTIKELNEAALERIREIGGIAKKTKTSLKEYEAEL